MPTISHHLDLGKHQHAYTGHAISAVQIQPGQGSEATALSEGLVHFLVINHDLSMAPREGNPLATLPPMVMFQMICLHLSMPPAQPCRP